MSLPKYSEEQKKVIKSLKSNNVLVDSVAGSGKTTTNLYLAKEYPQDQLLLLTYNAKLKIETRQKVSLLGIKNMEVHSYHSFAFKYYGRECYTDSALKKMLHTSSNNTHSPDISYDIIILDESQDMSPLYYQLFCKIYQDNRLQSGKKAKICLLGDRYQSIYQFNSADPRFITEAPKLFNINSKDWIITNLSYSFRVTHEIATFVNRSMLKQDRLQSKRVTFKKPKYIITDCFGSRFGISRGKSKAFTEIKHYLQIGYQPHEIFVLAPSVKNAKSPVRQLENDIKSFLRDIPVYVPVSDEEKLDQQVLKNKLVFSTFHQAKGLERKVVIVFNFDASYFQYFNKNRNPYECPNELYVAVTRARDHLILLHHYQNDFLPFIDQEQLSNTTRLTYHYKLYIRSSKKDKNRETSVTDLVKHLTLDTMDKCLQYITMKRRRKRSEKINIKSKTRQKYGHENVSEITGTAIPAYFEYRLKNTMNIFKLLGYGISSISTKNCLSFNNNDYSFISDEEDDQLSNNSSHNNQLDLSQLNLKKITPSQLLYLANKWCAYKNGFIFKLDQINNYNWLNNTQLQRCLDRLYNLGISPHAQFELKSQVENKHELFNRKIIGYFDCVDSNKLYEFKCVSMLKKEHILQLAIYAYLDYQIHGERADNHHFYLYNILNDELLEIETNREKLEQMVYYLIYTKYFDSKTLDDKSFSKLCQDIRTDYFLE
jgi:hypothetical protein